MMSLCCLQNNENDIQACSEQTVTHIALQHSLKESLFCMKQNPFCFKPVQAGILKLWPLLYRHAKVHENAVNTTATCSYQWLTYNIRVYFMKLTYSLQVLLLHSKLTCIDFTLITLTVQKLWSPQEGLHEQDQEKLGQNNLELRREIRLQFINVDVTDEVLSKKPLST